MFDTARDIIEESGVTGLWTGLKPGLVLTVNPAITYGVFEKLKGMVLAAAAVRAAGTGGDDAEVAKALNLGPGWSFLLGMTSKTLATVVTYPYIFVSNRAYRKKRPLKARGLWFPLVTAMTGKSTSTSKIAKDRLDSVALDVGTGVSTNDVDIAPWVVC